VKGKRVIVLWIQNPWGRKQKKKSKKGNLGIIGDQGFVVLVTVRKGAVDGIPRGAAKSQGKETETDEAFWIGTERKRGGRKRDREAMWRGKNRRELKGNKVRKIKRGGAYKQNEGRIK